MNGRTALHAAQGLLALALVCHTGPLSAAHVYAAVSGGIKVYDVSLNGNLSPRQTLATGPITLMAITPGGRYIYTTDDNGTITQYATQSDGTIRQQGAPLTQLHRGWHDMVMHPSGAYLFLYDRVTESVYEYSTDVVDGHLTFVASAGTHIEAESLAVDPHGEFLFAGSEYSCPGDIKAMRLGPNGAITDVGFFKTPSVTDRMAADTRFVYVQGSTANLCSTPEGLAIFSIMRIEPDGSLTTAKTYEEKVGPMLPIGNYLALARGDSLFIYAIDRSGNRTQTDSKPIETFAMTKGVNCFAGNLWVATDDGIVTYWLDSQTGKLSRLGKVMVNGAKPLVFGPR